MTDRDRRTPEEATRPTLSASRCTSLHCRRRARRCAHELALPLSRSAGGSPRAWRREQAPSGSPRRCWPVFVCLYVFCFCLFVDCLFVDIWRQVEGCEVGVVGSPDEVRRTTVMRRYVRQEEFLDNLRDNEPLESLTDHQQTKKRRDGWP
jgi:hypothetical protein